VVFIFSSNQWYDLSINTAKNMPKKLILNCQLKNFSSQLLILLERCILVVGRLMKAQGQ